MAGSRDRGGAARKRGEAAGAPGLRQRRPTAGSLLRSRSSLRSAGHGPGPGRAEAGSCGGIPGEGLEQPAAAPEARSAEAAAGSGREKDRSQRHTGRSSAHCMPGDVVLRHGPRHAGGRGCAAADWPSVVFFRAACAEVSPAAFFCPPSPFRTPSASLFLCQRFLSSLIPFG